MPPSHKPRKSPKKWPTVVVAVLIFLSIGMAARAVFNVERVDLEETWQLAEQEINSSLAFGERRLVTIKVYNRRASDYFRRTPGLLTSTNRRIIFVGVGAKDKLAGPDAPIPIESREYANDTTTEVDKVRVDLLTVPGIALASRGKEDKFAIYPGEQSHLDSMINTIKRTQAMQDFLAARDSTLREGVKTLERRALYYIVKRGDALINIAGRFGTIPDSLKSWNSLSSDRVRIRDSLIVKPQG